MTKNYKQTEIGEIPGEWEICSYEDATIKEHGDFVKLKTKDYQKTGKYPIVDQGKELIAGYTDNKDTLYSGGLPIIIFGDHTLFVKYVDFKFAVGADGTKIITANPDKYDSRFLFYAFSAKNLQSEGYKRHFSKLREQLFVRPSLKEQLRIADLLSCVDSAIQQTDEIIENAKALKKGLTQELLSIGIGHEKFQQTEIGEIPEDWKVTEIGKIAKQQEKVIVKSDSFVSFEHIESGTGKILTVDSVIKYRTKIPFQKGTLLYGRIRPYLNKIWLADRDGFSSTDMIMIVPVGCDASFLKYVLLSQKFVEFATAKSAGTKMPRVKWESIKIFQLALPTYSEQQKIAYIISSIETKIDTEFDKRSKLCLIKKGLMQDLLTGKVRFPEFIRGAN